MSEMLNGVKVFVDTHCVEHIDVERTLKERWLTWPWRPWAKTKTESVPAIYEVRNPSQGMFSLEPSHFLVAHPQKLKEIRALCNERR